MSVEIFVYGAGGHGKVIAESLAASGRVVSGFLDDHCSADTILGLPVFPASKWFRSHRHAQVALGIGDNRAREAAASCITQHGCSLMTVVHPSAILARSARIGDGVVIMPTTVINPDSEIGEGAIINTGAIVEHDVVIGRYAHLSPNCAVAGGATIGAYSHVGMGANVLPLKKVGAGCIIGAGAVVVSDIPDGETAIGVPARIRVSAR